MGVEHLQRLEDALAKRGWSVLQRDAKVDWYCAGIWEIQRNTKVGPLHLEFVAADGLGSSTVRDMPSAWCCKLSEAGHVSLYFYKLKRFDSELRRFLFELDRVENEQLDRSSLGVQRSDA